MGASFRHAWVGLLLLIAGCSGTIRGAGEGEGPDGPRWRVPGGGGASGSALGGDGDGDSSGAGAGGASGGDNGCAQGEIAAGPSQLRRLQPDEYANTARALYDDASLAPKLEPHVGAIISAHEVEVLSDAAADLATHAGHARHAPCDVAASAPDDEACVHGFIATFGKLAFRRPLDADEQAWLQGVYDDLRAADVTPVFSLRELIDALAEVMLQAPQHVYLHELGEPDDALPEGVRKLTAYERASRLSYLMASTMPDTELMQAADDGVLDTRQGVRDQAQRLLDAPAAHAMVRSLASSWLKLNDTPMHPSLEKLGKNEEKFPLDSPELRSAMRTESEQLYERAFYEGSFEALFTDTSAYVDGPLAQLYGVEDGPTEPGEFEWVQLPSDERAGLFTRAAFLTSLASADYQSPVLRGVHVYRHVLCQPLPDPPANVDNTPPEPSDADTPRSVRQLFEAKTSEGSCQGCHGKVNPVGFAFERYDALGQFQTEESGELDGEPYSIPVDSSADLNAGDLQGKVEDAIDLSRQLAQSAMAHDCMAETWFARLASREPTEREGCALDAIKARFQSSSDLRALVLDLASSDSALFIEEEAP